MTKVLVIEDDPEVRQTLVYILEDEGCEVVVADDGAQGVKKFATAKPDLVIADLFMPNQEGFQTIREILALRPGAKIIAVTAGLNSLSSAGRDDRDFYLRMARELGAVDVIPKPFEIDELLLCVRRCVAGPAS
jgi:DNA-binding response OmpR family regulator